MGTADTQAEESDLLSELPTAEGNAMWEIFSDYVPGYRFQFAVGGLASVIARFLELLPALILGLAIDTFFRDDGGSFAAEMAVVPASWFPSGESAQFLTVVGIIVGLYLVVAALNWVNGWAWNHFAQHLQHEVRTDTYNAVQGLDMAFFDDRQTGEIMSVLNNDVNQLEDFFTRDLNTFIRIAVLVVGVAAITLWVNWQFALVALVSVPMLAVASHVFVQVIQPKYQTVRSSVGRLNARLENNIGGIDVIKAYNREPYESARVEQSSQSYLDANWDAITTRIKFFPSLRVITGIGFGLTFLVGGWWVLNGPPLVFTRELSLGFFITFLLYSRRFLWPMRQFGEIINDYEYARAASERVFGLRHYTPGVADRSDATALTDVRGDVSYEGVTFSYDDEPEIRDVSFEAGAGEMVGLVGATGAGKTTLMRLLMRLYPIDEGAIRVDGRDIREVTRESLRDAIGYVSQEPFLFHGSIRENIAYGARDIDGRAAASVESGWQPGTNTDDGTDEGDDEADTGQIDLGVPEAEIVRAAKTAGAWEFIEELPDGLDTVVGERGVKLSGGQRQRVSLARALIKDPEILILDEATSHVDNETEVLIKNNLSELVADRTTFVIAHRLSTVRDADTILVLDDGEVVERGTHEELLARDGLYANLWSVQVGELDALPQEFIERTAAREASTFTDD